MIKSLRWRMQIWHVAILGVAIALFATAFYIQLHRSTLSEIDLELLSGARVLEGTLRTLPPPRQDGERPMFPPPGFGEGRGGPPGFEARPSRPVGEGRGGEGRGGERPGPGNRPRGMFGLPAGRIEALLQLPPLSARGPRGAAPYFAVFDPEGRTIRAEPSDQQVEWVVPRRSIEYRNQGTQREVLLRGPGDALIVVGADIRPQLDRLRAWLLQLIVTGVGVLAMGLVGGWWLSGKTIRPIQQISDTAGQINAANLSARIPTERMDSEVRTLASILNSMFGRLDQSFKQQSQFTADASHELRTPLAVLMSHCELALNRPRSTEEYKQTIVTCQKAGARMKMLVEDLLTLARADSGKLELDRSLVDLQLLVRDAAIQLASLAEERNVEIEIVGSTVTCEADARRVSQVILNLMSNAIYYNRAGGKVTVSSAMETNHAVVVVQDTGVGIPHAAVPHVFDRFYRVDEARSRQSGGSGLGLAICKSIVDAHAGELLVQSELNVGSRFTLRLPISLRHPSVT